MVYCLDYTTTIGAVMSSPGNATLSVADPSRIATGHLVNQDYALPQPLQLRVGTGAFAPLDPTSQPLKLATFTQPLSSQPAAIDVKQSIAPTDALRTGRYAKTLTFTLSLGGP